MGLLQSYKKLNRLDSYNVIGKDGRYKYTTAASKGAKLNYLCEAWGVAPDCIFRLREQARMEDGTMRIAFLEPVRTNGEDQK